MKKKAQERSIQKMWDTIKRPNLQIIVTDEEGSQVNGIGQVFNKVIKENFQRLRKYTLIQIQEAQRLANRQDQKRKFPQHIIVKTLHIQNKESVLRAAREKSQFTYKGKSRGITVYFLVEISKSRKVWSNVFQVLKDHDG